MVDDCEKHSLGLCDGKDKRFYWKKKATCVECYMEKAIQNHREWDQIGLGYAGPRLT